MRLFFKYIAFGFFIVSSLAAQADEFEGVVKMKPWSKSVESFCAGGSEYFVLKTESGQHILSPDENLEIKNKLKSLDGKKAKVIGDMVKYSAGCPEGSQCPSNSSIFDEKPSYGADCKSIKVEDIQELTK